MLVRNITKEYLEDHPHHIFVFGDNLLHKGYGGAAKLRDCPNAIGFVTKKAPNNNDESFFRPDEYRTIFEREFKDLEWLIQKGKSYRFIISPVGSGLANRYGIFELVINPELKKRLAKYNNIEFLW